MDAGVVGINSVSGVIKNFVELIRRIGFFARAFVIRSVRPCEIGNDRIFDARYQKGVVIRSYAYVELEDVLFAGGHYVAVFFRAVYGVENHRSVGFVYVHRIATVSAAFENVTVRGNELRAFRPAAGSARNVIADAFYGYFIVEVELNRLVGRLLLLAVVDFVDIITCVFKVRPGSESALGHLYDGRKISLQTRILFVGARFYGRVVTRRKSERGYERKYQRRQSHHYLFHPEYLLVDIFL